MLLQGEKAAHACAQVHAILTDSKGRNLETKKTTACKTDELTHVYTLHVMPNNTYRILIDNAEAAKGALHEDWDFEAPKQITARAPACGLLSQEKWCKGGLRAVCQPEPEHAEVFLTDLSACG